MSDLLISDLIGRSLLTINYSPLTILFRSQTFHPARAGFRVAHSVRNDSTGFAIAAFIV